jgi:iron(III) transport system permease protein
VSTADVRAPAGEVLPAGGPRRSAGAPRPPAAPGGFSWYRRLAFRAPRAGAGLAVWSALALLLVVPILLFLLLAFSPRPFGQGRSWFGLSSFRAAFSGLFAHALLDSLWPRISVALANLGSEFEDAARVHGAGRWRSARVVVPILAPALLSALAIGFAETISDFGVASTLAASAHFPVATYALFNAVGDYPADFSAAAAISWVLVAAAAIPVAVQARALRGRSFAVLSGRTRNPARRHLGRGAQVLGAAGAAVLFALALGAPITGAVLASMLKNFGVGFSANSFTLASYRLVLDGAVGLSGPLLFSTELAVVTASVVTILGLVVARMMTAGGVGPVGKLIDLILIGSVALPGIVLGAGYIFAYNLPFVGQLGIKLYETAPLLAVAYVATSLPSQSRLMVGPVAQLQDSLLQAARVPGASGFGAWRRAALPVLSRLMLWAWLLTFAKTFLELPVSQLLYPPGNTPVAVAINNFVGTSAHYGEATAMSVIAMAEMFGVIVAGLALFRWLAPRGWQRIGGFIDV